MCGIFFCCPKSDIIMHLENFIKNLMKQLQIKKKEGEIIHEENY